MPKKLTTKLLKPEMKASFLSTQNDFSNIVSILSDVTFHFFLFPLNLLTL